MTATNHALTGAVIALSVKQPALAIPLAFLSHFVLDALPHYGVANGDVFERNKKLLTKIVFSTDAVLFVVTLVWLGFFFHAEVSNTLLFWSAAAAYLPDLPWIYRFVREIRTRKWEPGGRYTRIHEKIQWGERPWGIIVEILWAIGALIAVEVLK